MQQNLLQRKKRIELVRHTNVCLFFFFLTQSSHTRAGNCKDLIVNISRLTLYSLSEATMSGVRVCFQQQEQRQRPSVHARLTSGQPGMCMCGPLRGRRLRFRRVCLSVSCMSSCPVADHCVRLRE